MHETGFELQKLMEEVLKIFIFLLYLAIFLNSISFPINIYINLIVYCDFYFYCYFVLLLLLIFILLMNIFLYIIYDFLK
jgi:hypothetical protein